MGGFPTQRFTGYEPFPGAGITNQQFVEDEEAARLVDNAIAVFSHSKRLVGSSLGIGPDVGATEDLTFELTPENPATIIRLPMSQIVTGASGKIRVTILAARDDDTATIGLEVNAGRDSARGFFTAATGVYGLTTAVVEVDRNTNPALYSDEELTISLYVSWTYGEGNSVAVAVRGVYAYELGDTNKHLSYLNWIDTTGANNKIGQPDYPDSPSMQRILNNNARACYGHRVPQGSIIHRCFRLSDETITTSYDGDEAGLGEWIIRKPRGSTVVEAAVKVFLQVLAAGDMKFSLYSIESLDYDNEVAAFTAGDLLTGQTTGVQARILKVVDAGATGTLYLGFLNGANLYQAAETIKDESGGEALVNGAMTGPLSIASDENPIAGGSQEEFSIAGQIEEEGEYWARLDAKVDASTALINVPRIIIVDGLAADVTYELPLSSNVEQDDDVRALQWLRVKNTLEKVWARGRSILASDTFFTTGGQLEGKVSSYAFNGSSDLFYLLPDGIFGVGSIYPSPGARVLRARVWVRRSDTRFTRLVDLAGVVGAPVTGDIATGATSGATGYVEAYSGGGSPVMIVSDMAGSFQNGEVINFAASGASATAASTPYTFDSTIKIRLGAWVTSHGGDPLVEHEIDASNLPQGQVQKLEFRIPLSSEYVNDYTVHGAISYVWVIETKATLVGDHLILDKYQVFEEPLLPGGFTTTLE